MHTRIYRSIVVGTMALTSFLRAQETPPEPSSPIPDILKEVASRPPMKLEDFQEIARKMNPSLAQAQAIVSLSAGQAKQAGLWLNPTAGYQGEEIRGGSYAGGKQGAFVGQTIVLGGKLGLRRNVYEQQRKQDEVGVDEQRYRVTSAVGQQYYSTLAAQEIVNVRQRLVQLASDVVTTARQLGNVGQADAPDILQSEVEAEQAKLDYAVSQREYLQRFRALAAVAGQPELPVRPVVGKLDDPPQLNTDQVISNILAQSPTVKRAQQNVVRAEAQIKSSKRESIPDLQLQAGLQNNLEQLNDAGTRRVGVHGFGQASVNLPIFNRNQGNVAAAKADLERAQQDVRRVQLSLQQNAQPLLQNYLAGQTQATRYKSEILPRAQRAYQLYRNKYQQMASAYPQVLVSQRTVFQLQITYIRVLEELWTNAIALQNFALSGGLNEAMPSGQTEVVGHLPTER